MLICLFQPELTIRKILSSRFWVKPTLFSQRIPKIFRGVKVFAATVFPLPGEYLDKLSPKPIYSLQFHRKFSARTAHVLNFFLFYSPSLSHQKQKHPEPHTQTLSLLFQLFPHPPIPSPHCTNFQARVCCYQHKHWVGSGVKKPHWFFFHILGQPGRKKPVAKGGWLGRTYCKSCSSFLPAMNCVIWAGINSSCRRDDWVCWDYQACPWVRALPWQLLIWWKTVPIFYLLLDTIKCGKKTPLNLWATSLVG